MKFLIIDNYDSFVYNIAQYLGELGVECDVFRNDKITISQIKENNYGPTTPILGVCLGHQGIIDAFGGKVTNAGCVRHGKTSPVKHTNSELFKDVKNPFRATRYHSLVGDKTIIPDILEVTATANDDGEIMAIKHKEFLIQGVQFHPESIMTEDGKKILGNFIRQVKEK